MLSSLGAMKAMLLAAGVGERMLPLTRLLPKPAIPVLGRPMAVQILSRMALDGISTAVVNLHHQPEKMKALLCELDLAEFPHSCPHGRPVAREISYTDIERMFKRT